MAHDRQSSLPTVNKMSHFDANTFLIEVPMDDTGGKEVGCYVPRNLSWYTGFTLQRKE